MKKKILITEDDVLLLETLKDRLEASDYEIVSAENGKDGAFKAISEKPDLLLVDLLMPEVSGIEMIEIVRANTDLKKTPIIVISALGRESDIDNAMKVGANDYIVKPYSFTDLLEKIEKILQ